VSRHKYRAIRTIVDGISFPSAKQSRRYSELKLLERAGEIKDLKLEVPFALAPAVIINGRKKPALRYVADFVYVEKGQRIIEDTKGFRSQAYIIKRHLMKSVHSVDIYET
jgi:hypothetical protein